MYVSESTPATDQSPAGKGRATPSRKEAEALRKATLKVPSDPKAAKKAARQREAAERAKARQAVLSGDESALPPRDAGPVKSFVRDFVDRRRCTAELFLPLALMVLALGFIPQASVQRAVATGWLVLTVMIFVDLAILLFTLNKQLKAQWPDKPARRGALFYAGMRALQIRKLRLPPPKFKAGGRPVTPKKPKAAKAPKQKG